MILELGVTFVGGDFSQGFPIMCEVLEQVRRTQAPLAPHYHNPPLMSVSSNVHGRTCAVAGDPCLCSCAAEGKLECFAGWIQRM